jgi:glycosyltransferase involved in cell wall biosynthesis
MAQSLYQHGIDVRVFCLTRGEVYEAVLRAAGIEVTYIGRHDNPLLRLLTLTTALGAYRPHIVQSTHFYTNLYAAGAGRVWRALTIGAIRSNVYYEMNENGRWGPWLLRMPAVLIGNSQMAKDNAQMFASKRVHVLSNVIDLDAFDQQAEQKSTDLWSGGPAGALLVARLVPVKRVERFLQALARVRSQGCLLRGVIVGDGPSRPELEALAVSLGLCNQDGVRFLGMRDDVPALLRQGSMFVLTSDNEGFPNVVLEAMAAGLPVITTPAGDAGVIVQNGLTGYIVPFDDIDALANHMARLAESSELRQQFGIAGRQRAEDSYGLATLAERLLSLYHAAAHQTSNQWVLNALSELPLVPLTT